MSLYKQSFGMVALACVVILQPNAKADTATATSTETETDAVHNPDNTKGVLSNLDWQAAWGSIHINSAADGLNDPGALVSSNGQVPCAYGQVCSSVGNPTGGSRVISNGIKYDIKNSLLNCMSKPMQNWAVIHGPPASAISYQFGVCASIGMTPGYGTSTAQPAKLLYFPIYDRRSNDTQTTDSGQKAGCVQQIVNTCGNTSTGAAVRDIHSCVNTHASQFPDGCAAGTTCDEPGYNHPVTHVFTNDEVADLGGVGAQMPTSYYVYSKKVGSKTRKALSIANPETFPDRETSVPVEKVGFESDPNLARLKAYSLNVADYGDMQKFIIMDPAEFFDLNLYTKGGKYDAGYNQFTTGPKPLVQTFSSCPILGLGGGYGGICDPTGNAGCNLPIYGVGPSTQFTDVQNNTYTYNDYKIKWSGYVKTWQVITRAHFFEDIRGRDDYYFSHEYVNNNPVIKVTRANEYCEDPERTSFEAFEKGKREAKPPVPDLPCTQYMQWQDLGDEWTWVNLYDPIDADIDTTTPAFYRLHVFNIDKDGKPDVNNPVKGTGSDEYIGGDGTKFGFVSFRDVNAKYFNLQDDPKKENPLPAVEVMKPVKSTHKIDTAGEYLGKDNKHGTGVGLPAGNMSTIRMQEELTVKGEDTSCVFVNSMPDATGKMFIPTNSQGEVQAFVDTLSEKPVNGVSVRNCNTAFSPNSIDGSKDGPKKEKAVGQTWVGTTDCAMLAIKPACNETRMISAQRYCQYENGTLGDCESCDGVADPEIAKGDKSFYNFILKPKPGMEVLVSPLNKETRCHFSAACFNTSSGGCPSPSESGGHVFCLAAETKIQMADGKTKSIKDIKPGDKVIAFDAKHSRNDATTTSTVKATAITKKQKVVKINDLKITPLHKIVLASGRAVKAKDIKVGDVMLKANGMIEEVKTIDNSLAPITVYNLVLEKGSDGYIAGGVRVLSYPILKGMEVTGDLPQLASDLKRKIRKNRKPSSK